jgi:hypothetical protein
VMVGVSGEVEDACSTHAEAILFMSLWLFILIKGGGGEPTLGYGRSIGDIWRSMLPT